MAKKGGLTLKRMKNKRFYKTEEAIFQAVSSSGDLFSVRKIAKKIKVARSTIYRHHGALYLVIPNYEKYILSKYDETIRNQIVNNEVELSYIYLKTLIFIMNHKKIFKVLVRRGNGRILRMIVDRLEFRIVSEYCLPKNYQKIFNIYNNEVCGLIECWIRRGFLEDQINGVVQDIMYLTKTMRGRLLPIID